MHLVFLITNLERGGAETQLACIAPRLKLRGWDITIIAMMTPTAYVPELEAGGISVVALGGKRGVPSLRTFTQTIRILRQLRPEVLVTFNFPADMLGRVAGRVAGVPTIVASIRSAHTFGLWREWAYRWTDRLVSHTVANCACARDVFVRRRILAPGRVGVLPNGLDVAAFQERAREGDAEGQAPEPCRGFRWVAVGNIQACKDYPTTLQAVRLLAAEGQDFHLLVAGGGPSIAELRALVDELQLSARVTFLGLRADVPAILSRADGYVLSSTFEGMPNAVMEAMAAGLPVVATRVGGVPELVVDGVTGLLVRPGQPAALADAMARIMRTPLAERQAMGLHGQQRLRELYDLEKVVDRWHTLLQELISTRQLRA